MSDKILCREILTTTDATKVFTNASGNASIKKVLLTNVSSSGVTVSLFTLKQDETAAAQYAWACYESTIGANDSKLIEFDGAGWVIDWVNSNITAQCSVANALVVNMNGVK